MNIMSLGICFLFVFSAHAVDLNPVGYIQRYKAVTAYKNQDYQEAQQLFEEVIAKDHTDYETIYNLGKVAYTKKEFDKAEKYFFTVTQEPDIADQKKIQAWFDLGNTQVQLKQLEQALESYQQVLTIYPEHEHAQKMIEAIEKLLEQQKQQQQQQEKNKDEQQKDKQDDQNQHDQDQEQQQGNDDSQNNENQSPDNGDDQQGENQSQQNQNEQQDQDGANQDSKNGNENEHNQNESSNNDSSQNEQSEPGENQQGSASKGEQQDEQRDEFDEQNGEKQDEEQGGDGKKEEQHEQPEGKPGDDAEQQLNGQQTQDDADQRDNHENSSTESPLDEDTQEEKKEQEMDAQAVAAEQTQDSPTDDLLDERELLLLKLLEDRDAKALKSMLKGTIKQEMPEQHGQKNW